MCSEPCGWRVLCGNRMRRRSIRRHQRKWLLQLAMYRFGHGGLVWLRGQIGASCRNQMIIVVRGECDDGHRPGWRTQRVD